MNVIFTVLCSAPLNTSVGALLRDENYGLNHWIWMAHNLAAALLLLLLHRLLGTPEVGRYGKEEIGSSLFLGHSWNETLFYASEQTKWKSRDKPMETWATSAAPKLCDPLKRNNYNSLTRHFSRKSCLHNLDTIIGRLMKNLFVCYLVIDLKFWLLIGSTKKIRLGHEAICM